MKKYLFALCVAGCILPFSFAQNRSTQTTPFNLAPIVKTAMPSVASVVVKRNTPFSQRIKEQMQEKPTSPNYYLPQLAVIGAAVVIDAKHGLLVTNAHIVHDAKQIIISFKNNDHYIGKLVGKSDNFDIALIQINAKNLSAIPIANSDTVQIGDFVVAIGNPYGLSQTVTSGIVSAVNRSESIGHGSQSLIQTDAPINLGNSGGPLINLNGQLVGINTAIYASSTNPGSIGLGFAVPSNIVNDIVYQLTTYGNVKKGVLGVLVQDLTPDLSTAFGMKHVKGCLVTQVVKNSPADRAGIKPGDIILSFDNRQVLTATQLRSMTSLKRPGAHVVITLWRDGKKEAVRTTIADAEKVPSKKSRLLGGLSLQTFNELSTNGNILKGIGVLNVEDDSMAQLAGLLPGDIILNANHQPTTDIQALEKIAEGKQRLLLEILRNKGKLFIVLKNS
jgi:serine protease Do